jgi:tRNA-Thr(GGU) m(6)t(6)A37 methyltransferase TsaA
MDIVFKPVGVVRTQASQEEVRTDPDQEGVLEIYPAFEDALDGIDGFSHLFVICHFNKLRPEQVGPLKVKPRGLLRRGLQLEELPLLGVFALDSPTRPNPIGLTLVQFVRRKGTRLFVKGLDYFDGTPILDIKGYRPQYRAERFSMPDWHSKLMERAGQI